jgi:hypothetical protein
MADLRLRCVRDGEPIKVVTRDLGLSKNSVASTCAHFKLQNILGIDGSYRLAAYRYHIDELLHRSPRITAILQQEAINCRARRHRCRTPSHSDSLNLDYSQRVAAYLVRLRTEGIRSGEYGMKRAHVNG